MFLAGNGVDKDILRHCRTFRQAFVERRVVRVSALVHLANESFVAGVEGAQLADPALRFGVGGVAAGAAVYGKNVPQTVEFAVFAEEMLATEVLWVNVPDAHMAWVYH